MLTYIIGTYIVIGCVYSLYVHCELWRWKKICSPIYDISNIFRWPIGLWRCFLFPRELTEEEIKEADDYFEKKKRK